VTGQYAPQIARRGQVPLVELAAPIAAAEVDPAMWQAWLADPDTRRRYEALVYRRGPGQCVYWLGAISSTGHGKFRAGSRARARPDAGPSRIVTAHVYAYQLHYGALPAAWAGQIVIRHQCDETTCQAWEDQVSSAPSPTTSGTTRPGAAAKAARWPTGAAHAAAPWRSVTRSWPRGGRAPVSRKRYGRRSSRASRPIKNAFSEEPRR
jgi:hypothetical protein